MEPTPTVTLQARVCTVEDWQAWRDLRLRSLADSPNAFGSTLEREQAFTDADWRGRVTGWTDPDEEVAGPAVLAEADGTPVGMGGGFRDEPGMLHVVAMWTDPDWRGRGVGALVLDTLRGWADERELRLHLDVEASNTGARRLYERYGFTATGGSKPLRPGSTYSCDRMVLR
jgi:GNAT superfamily N-acetyltransferase